MTTTPTDLELAGFVATSATILGLQLDDQAQAAVRDAMRGLLVQAALVLDYPKLVEAAHPHSDERDERDAAHDLPRRGPAAT